MAPGGSPAGPGATYCGWSLPITATSRARSHGITDGSSPADRPPSARPRSHGPIASEAPHQAYACSASLERYLLVRTSCGRAPRLDAGPHEQARYRDVGPACSRSRTRRYARSKSGQLDTALARRSADIVQERSLANADVIPGIEVRVRDAVIGHADPVGAEAEHRELVRRRVVHRLLGVRVAGQRHRHAVAHERGRLTALLGRDQVERADLIVLTPAPPVGELGLPALVLCG